MIVDEIVVTAARLPPAAGDAAFAVIRLDQDDLEASRRVDEALTGVPAVSLFRRTSSLSANPTTQGISLRAIAPSGAGRTLVTLDGVPLNDPFGGWVIWSQLAPESLDSLDIVRGSGAGPYGAGALTGVIVLREREGGGVLDASVAERGGARLSGSGSRGFGRLTLTASGLYEHSDGYVPVRGPERGAADTPTDLESLGGALRADWATAGDIAVSARFGAWEDERGAGLDQARAVSSGQIYSLTAARRPGADRMGWRAQVWRHDSDLSNTFVAVEPDRSAASLSNNQYATPATGLGANLALRRAADRWGGSLEWEAGADIRSAEGEVREVNAFGRLRVAGGETLIAGAYAEGSWTGGPWLVAGGLRADRWSNENGRRLETNTVTDEVLLDQRSPDRDGEVVSARLAARRDLGAGWAARAAAYTGFRPPTLNELHRPFRVGNDITEANPGLEPEVLRGVEAGLAWSGGAVDLTATVFHNEIEDAIVNVTIGVGPGTFPVAGFVPAGGVLRERRNAGVVEATGVEVEARWRLETVTLSGGLSATDARMDGGTDAPQLTGLRPAQAPIWSATGGIDWRASDRLGLSARARYESRRFDDDLNSRALDSALVLDARAEWRANAHTVLYLAADNLFDEDVETARTGDDVPGYGTPRIVRAGLRLSY